MMKKFKLINNLLGWLVFMISGTVYLLTIEPTVSLWDCGEFISSSFKLQVGHPPGAPLFMIIARFFSLFAGGHVDQVAKMVNSFSAIASALTIMFLFWTITHLGLKLMLRSSGVQSMTNSLTSLQMILVLGSGLLGALAYTFTDTFWFSAVEGEVYASSSLFTAMVFWAILKWENVADEKYANRWLILIAYLCGLSVGVHLLNLLAIPAVIMVYYFRKYKISKGGVIKALLLSIFLLGTLVYLIIPGVIWLASRFELIFVNGFGLPFNSGVLFYAVLLIGGLAWGIWRSHMKRKVILNTILLSIAVIIIGYSSYSMIVIRSLANPPLDENNPETVFSLLYYINREQYGDRPLVKGQYFNARAIGYKQGKATYTPVDGKYKITNRDLSYKFDNDYTTLFPRMWSSQSNHIEVYLAWGGIKESDIYHPQRDEEGNIKRDNDGNILYDRSSPKSPPGFFNNLKFFLTYQLVHMYFRYFMWNFVGRQNDIQADGGPLYGNWISGIPFIDKILIGSEDKLPDFIRDKPSRNTYFFLPLLFGLLGLVYQYQQDNKNFWVIFLLFVLTGIAIVVYLNQTPQQPRERDYSYSGSFYAFSIWIGLGLISLFSLFGKKLQNNLTAIFTLVISLLAVPGIIASENWDDHDRSGRYTARDIAYNYLNSCAPNAILFTNGDNDTFPLWYAQEVEGIRTDVRVVNLMLLNMDWYIDQMKKKVYESEPLPISLSTEKYLNGTRDRVYIQEVIDNSATLKEIIDVVSSEDPRAKIQASTGESFNYIPTRNFRIPVDTTIVLNNGTVKRKDADKIVTSIEWRFNPNYIGKSELIVMDILANNNWQRPIYFASIGHEGTLGLENFMQLEGLAYRLVPIESQSISRYEAGRIDTEIMYDNLMNKFRWGNMNDTSVYLDDFHVRTISIIRMRSRFAMLASALEAEGDTIKAISVLDRCLELTPDAQVPFDYTLIQIADLYHRCGEVSKGNFLIETLGKQTIDRLSYYLDQSRNYVMNVRDELNLNFQILQNLVILGKNYGQTELSEKFQNAFNEQYALYLSKNGRG